MATVADQQGYALLSQPAPLRAEPVAAAGWGSAAYVLVFIVIFIILVAILAAFFWQGSGNKFDDSSSDDRHHSSKGSWDFNLLAGLVIFIIVLMALCWLLSTAFGGHRY